MLAFRATVIVMPTRILLAASFLLVGLGILPATAQQYWPRQVPNYLLNEHPYDSVGLVFSKVGRGLYRGSGAVARDERLMYGCAHVIYDRGVWASSVRFARAYSGFAKPKSGRFTKARGFHYISGYSPRWWGWFPDWDFGNDFAIAYKGANGTFGPHLGHYRDATTNLLERTDVEKLIVGYPSTIAYLRKPGRYFMYRTGSFFRNLYPESGNYFGIDGLSTGKGNSGGPVLTQYQGKWYLAGILVSGNRRDAGVYVLNPAADEVARRALDTGEKGIRLTRSSFRYGLIADGGKKFARRTLNFSGNSSLGNFGDTARGKSLGVPPSIRRVKLSLDIRGRQGDLVAYVRSPKGRIHFVAKPNLQNNIFLRDLDLTEPFSATDPRGKWAIFFRDRVPGGPRAQFVSTSLTLESRWER